MATENPYNLVADAYYHAAWRAGYQYGSEHLGEDSPHPPTDPDKLLGGQPYDPDVFHQYLAHFQQVWSEGDLAARQDHHPNIPHLAQPANIVADGMDAVHLAWEGGSVAVKLLAGAATVGEVGALSVSVFAALIGLSEPTDQDMAIQDLKAWFAQACKEYNCADFYLAVDWPNAEYAHGWHGPQVHDTFDAARDDAAAHLGQHPHLQVQVAHYQATSPDVLEMIPLEPERPNYEL